MTLLRIACSVYFFNFFLFINNAYDYCNSGLGAELCGSKKHFLCDETQAAQAGTFKYVYPQIRDWTDRMVEWHNIYRDQVASGEAKNEKKESFPSASHMRVLLWDNELAFLSYMHVSRCNASKTKCHKTKKFKKAGQNFGRVTLAMNSTALKVLEQNINAWFMEKDKISGKEMSIVPDERLKDAEHFMIMVNDEVSKVGCAMAFCTDCDPKKDDSKYCYYITCHYNFGALGNYRLYKDGEPASNCDYWGLQPSKQYTSLCENKGRDFSDMECTGDDSLACTRDGMGIDEWTAAKADNPPSRKSEYEYCSNGVGDRICASTHVRHFICDDSQVEQVGTCVKVYPTTGEWRAAMLDKHNELRNQMASGKENNGKGEIFPPAARMRTLLWDDELAYLSKMHVKKCNMTHSVCHKVPRWLYTGQNLAYIAATGQMTDMFDVCKQDIHNWYNEKNLVSGNELRIYPRGRVHEVGHLMVMVNDEVGRVGCAFAHCKNCEPDHPENTDCYFITCHYDFGAYSGRRIYFVGDKPASDCEYWDTVPDKKYPNLCKNNGIDYPTIRCRANSGCFRDNIPVDEWKHP